MSRCTELVWRHTTLEKGTGNWSHHGLAEPSSGDERCVGERRVVAKGGLCTEALGENARWCVERDDTKQQTKGTRPIGFTNGLAEQCVMNVVSAKCVGKACVVRVGPVLGVTKGKTEANQPHDHEQFFVFVTCLFYFLPFLFLFLLFYFLIYFDLF